MIFPTYATRGMEPLCFPEFMESFASVTSKLPNLQVLARDRKVWAQMRTRYEVGYLNADIHTKDQPRIT